MQEWPQYTLRNLEAGYGGRTQSEKLRPNFTETTENKLQPIRPTYMARAWTAHRKNSEGFHRSGEIVQLWLLRMNSTT